MKAKQYIKKVAAVAAGSLMVGTTLLGAFAAADLADYPQPFVTDGMLSNSIIVVGEKAATSDVLGAIEVAASLQAAAVSMTPIDVGGVVDPTISSGVEIKKSGDKLNYGENLSGVQSTALDETDLPDILGKETFDENRGETDNEVDYTQSLEFGTETGVFNLYQPEDMDAGDYLFFQDGKDIYTYTLEFDSSVDWDSTDAADDFEGAKIVIQGNEYTISNAKFTSSNTVLDELTLIAGDSTRWLQQDQPLTVGDHTVTVVNVNEDQTMCGVDVDGVTRWVDVGSTEVLAGLSIGVLDAIAVHSKDYDQDTCEISVGSMEILLKDGNRVEVNGDEIEGSEVSFTSSSSTWDSMTVTYDPDDDGYLAPGEAWTDPVMGNFKIVFGGVTEKTEDMTFKTSGNNDGEFVFMNSDGKEVTIPYYVYDDSIASGIKLGQDDDELLLLPGETATNSGSTADGHMLLYTTSGGETHVLEITDIDTTNSKIDIKDVTYGTTWSDKDYTALVENPITLGSLGSVKLNISANGYSVKYVSDASYGAGTPETELGATLSIKATNVTITENDVVEAEVTGDVIFLSWNYDTGSDDRLEILTPTSTNTLSWVDASETDDNTEYAVTEKGTLVEYDAEDGLDVTLTYPEDDVYANVFVAPLAAKVTTAGGSEVMAEKVNPFSVGLAVLDTDAEGMTKNMIVVGGPCVNVVAADLMGNPTACAEGFEPGKAKLKLFESGSRVSLLVAGYSAQDSLGAAYVLADYEDYSLSGDEMEVVVTSLNDIDVVSVS